MYLIFCLIINLGYAWSSTYTMQRGSSIQLLCPLEDGEPTEETNLIGQPGPPGKMGPAGPQGSPGPPGAKESDTELRRRYGVKIEEMESYIAEEKILGTHSTPAGNCQEIKDAVTSSENGLYFLRDGEGNVFLTYCDMVTAGGGWTLIASVHENNMKGKCTTGDRWSSEQGNSAEHPHGDGFWENRAVHGSASSATSDDYKNSGYFAMSASDVMIWQVPNDTPLENFESEAYLKYHTTSGFLGKYGGNLQTLFSRHYPLRSEQFSMTSGNGPAIPVTWDRGDNAEMVRLTPVGSQGETEPGYIQFRAINGERSAFALCHGVRIKPNFGNVEHVCVGSTSNNIGHVNEDKYCGDFAAKDWTYSQGTRWKAVDKIINSVIMIFSR